MMYLQLFLSFLQIGALSFGGGYAAMPLIEAQIVTTHGWLTDCRQCSDVRRHENRGRSRCAGCNSRLHSARVYPGHADCKALSQVPESVCFAECAGFSSSGGRGNDCIRRRDDSAERLLGRAHDCADADKLPHDRHFRAELFPAAQDEAQSHCRHGAGRHCEPPCRSVRHRLGLSKSWCFFDKRGCASTARIILSRRDKIPHWLSKKYGSGRRSRRIQWLSI